MLTGAGLLAGPPVSDISLRILRDCWGKPVGPFTTAEFDAQCCAANEPGEIVVTGDHVLKGYLGGAGDEETKFSAGDTVWRAGGALTYRDMELPQDVCNAGRVLSFGKTSEPALAATSKSPFASGLSPTAETAPGPSLGSRR